MNYKETLRIQKLINGINNNSMGLSELLLNGELDESTTVLFLVGLNQDIKEIKGLIDTEVLKNEF